MTLTRRRFVGFAGVLALPGPAFARGADEIDLVGFFLGRTRGAGLFDGSAVGVRRRFDVTATGRMEGRDLILVEHIAYEDGIEDTAVWRFAPAAHGFTGRRSGVDTLVEVRVAGSRATMGYVAEVPGMDGERVRLRFEDTLVRTGPRTLLNTADVSYLGLRIGTVEVEFRKG